MTQSLNEFSINLQQTLSRKLTSFPNSDLSQELDLVLVRVEARDLVRLSDFLKHDTDLLFSYFASLSVVDYEQLNNTFEVVYHLISLTHKYKLCMKISIPYDDPRIDSVTNIWRAANWFERESHDLYGVVFKGHPNLEPLLLYEDFEGYPGRKSFPFHEYKEW